MKLGQIVVSMLVAITLGGCMSASDHRNAVRDDSDKLTVGKVQRQITVGMSGGDVAQVLGSPNIVTTDEQRREVWVYDKISTDTAYSTSSGGVSSLILGTGAVLGLAGGGYNSSSGAKSTNQKTLTIVIKFDDKGLVRDFSYNSSSF